MKKIKSFYYEIVISKIYMLEKYKREFDEGNIYNGIWGTLQTFVVYTVISFIFILIRIFGTLQNPLATGIGVVILCQIAVQIVHEEYLKMNVEERKKHYKRGLWKLIPIFFYPIIIIAFLKLITVIFQVASFSCNCL